MNVARRKFEHHMLQDIGEFERFLSFIRGQNVRSFLEIGSKNGGTFWRISNLLPKGSRVVSVDLPQGDTSFKDTQRNLEQCVSALADLGYDAYLFLGDSTNSDIIEKVKQLGPFDL